MSLTAVAGERHRSRRIQREERDDFAPSFA